MEQQPQVIPQLALSNEQLQILEGLAYHLQRELLGLRFSRKEADEGNIRQHVHLTAKLEMLKEIFGYDETAQAAAQERQNMALEEAASQQQPPQPLV